MKKDLMQQTIEYETEVVKSITGYDGEIFCNTLGGSSRVYLINEGEIVFKFPIKASVIQEYKDELSIHHLLHSIKSSVQLPIVLCQSNSLKYLGYKGITGKTLDSLLYSLSIEDKRNIGHKIGIFLSQLHKLRPLKVDRIILPKEIQRVQQKFFLVKNLIQDKLTNTDYLKIQLFIENLFPQKLLSLGANYCFCHGDLGGYNIIYNSKSENLGVIDFGGAGHFDNAKDFSCIDDSDIRSTMLDSYNADQNLREKVKLRTLTIPIINLCFFVQNNLDKDIVRTLNQIQKNIDQYL